MNLSKEASVGQVLAKHWPGIALAGVVGIGSVGHIRNQRSKEAYKTVTAAMDPLEGGLAEGDPDSDFNMRSIQEGMKVEKEHTVHKSVQKRIAKDHLKEDPKYYLKLKKIEAKK